MPDSAALYIRQLRQSGYRLHFVHHHRVDDVGWDANRPSNIRSQDSSQIRRMLSISCLTQICQHYVVNNVCTTRDRFEQTSATYYRTKVLGFQTSLSQGRLHSLPAKGILVNQA